MDVEKIKLLIYQSIDVNENGFNTENEKTAILNVEHSIGKYHAYMDVLEIISMEEFIIVAEDTKNQIEEFMRFVEKIYK